MIVGYKTERFITVQRDTDQSKGYLALGIEQTFELHATKGWRRGSRRRQYLGHCEKPDALRASLSEVSVTFKLNTDRKIRARGAAAIPITEKMLARHRERRRDIRRAAAKEAWNNA